jgi:hypothetical protein
MKRKAIEWKALDAMKEHPIPPEATPELTVKRCMMAMGAKERAELMRAAYKAQLPAMADRESIRAFIACVAHGIAISALEGQQASKMLYAAQVAMSLNKEEKPNGRPRGAPRRAAAKPKGEQK